MCRDLKLRPKKPSMLIKITYVICSIPSYVLNFGHFFTLFVFLLKMESVATLALGSQPRQRGYKVVGQKGRKPGSQGKEAARVRTKRKPESHITYSQECKKV